MCSSIRTHIYIIASTLSLSPRMTLSVTALPPSSCPLPSLLLSSPLVLSPRALPSPPPRERLASSSLKPIYRPLSNRRIWVLASGSFSQLGLFTPECGVRLHVKLNAFPSTYTLETCGSLFKTRMACVPRSPLPLARVCARAVASNPTVLCFGIQFYVGRYSVLHERSIREC